MNFDSQLLYVPRYVFFGGDNNYITYYDGYYSQGAV